MNTVAVIYSASLEAILNRCSSLLTFSINIVHSTKTLRSIRVGNGRKTTVCWLFHMMLF